MKLAIYGKKPNKGFGKPFIEFLNKLNEHRIPWYIYESFKKQLESEKIPCNQHAGAFTSREDLNNIHPDCLLSFGGDGTLLDSVSLLAGSEIPVLGINAGRLGFLSSTGMDRLDSMIEELKSQTYKVEERSLLQFSASKSVFPNGGVALNDFTIHKRDTSAMITIHAYLNGELLNTYWSDGLVVATPTGSTAYSLSCGGPVIFPDTKSFVITPVASHNISIRSLIVPDNSMLSFEVEGRGKNFLISLDSRYAIVDYSFRFSVSKAAFPMKFVKLQNQSFIATLREKLMLGIDNRNANFP